MPPELVCAPVLRIVTKGFDFLLANPRQRRIVAKMVRWFSILPLLIWPAVAQAQWNYTVNTNQTITITGYTGPGGAVAIPAAIYGIPVAGIASDAFYYHSEPV